MIAALHGHKEILSLLVERGGNIDLQNEVRLYHPSPPYKMGILVLDTIPMLYHVVSYLYCIPLPPPSLLHLPHSSHYDRGPTLDHMEEIIMWR